MAGRDGGGAEHRGRLSQAVGGPARSRVIVLLACVLGLSTADAGAVGALAAPLEATFHVGNFGLGLLVAATTLVGALATLPFGVLADRCNRSMVLQIAVVTWGMATIVSAFSLSYGMLLATRVGLGVLVAAAGPLVVSMAGDLFPADERSRLFGFVLTGELIGAGFGIVAAGTLSGLLGWRPALGFLALPAFVLVWCLRRYLPEPGRGGQSVLQVGAAAIPVAGADPVAADPADRASTPSGPAPPGPAPSGPAPSGPAPSPQSGPSPESGPSAVLEQAEAEGVTPPPHLDADAFRSASASAGLWTAVRYILRVRTNLALIVASGLGYFFLQGLQTFAELFFRDRYGVGQSLASVLFIFIGAGSIIGVLVGGRLADSLIERGFTSARLVVAAVAFVATAVFFVPGLLSTSLAVSIPLFVIAGAAIGGVNPPLDAARLDVVPSSLWGRAEAVRTTLRTALQGTAPVIFGVLSSAFGASSFGLGAGIDTSGTKASAASGQGLAWAFMVLSTPLILAGLVLACGRHRYLRDVVAAGRVDHRHPATTAPPS